jgi:hypothetical protein
LLWDKFLINGVSMFAAFAVGGGLLVSVGEAGAAFGGERFGKGGEILLQITVHAPFYALV